MEKLYARFNHPTWGYSEQGQEAIKSGLVVGERYEVDLVNMGQSSTTVHLKGYHGVFNSVLFDFEDEDKSEHDIFRDKKYNPFIEVFKEGAL